MLEYIIGGAAALLVIAAVVFLIIRNKKKKDDDSSDSSLEWQYISIEANGVKITATDYNAGAITSVTWNGKEFIDDRDHGRQLQSASFFNGDYYNPTEAGANWRIDGHNPHSSSSVLIGWSNANNVFSTKTNMAFWKETDGKIVSNHMLDKRVQIGAFGHGTAIKYVTKFTLPRTDYKDGMFEMVTGYMPTEFNQFYTVNPANGAITRVNADPDDGTNERGLPGIISVAGGTHAMGAVTRGIPQKEYKNLGYGLFKFDASIGCNKWNNVYRIRDKRAIYDFESYVAVGTLQQVGNILSDIYNKIN